MNKDASSSNHILQLEETLQILEESIQHDAFSTSSTKQHIQRLKSFYSPRFDFEFSESGSYYYAALHCVCDRYLNDDCKHNVFLSSEFKQSLSCLLEISRLSLNSKNHQTSIVEELLLLAKLWGLNETLDIPTLLLQALVKMRSNLLASHA